MKCIVPSSLVVLPSSRTKVPIKPYLSNRSMQFSTLALANHEFRFVPNHEFRFVPRNHPINPRRTRIPIFHFEDQDYTIEGEAFFRKYLRGTGLDVRTVAGRKG